MANDTDMPVADQLQQFLRLGSERLRQPVPLHSHGTLTRLTGLVLEASGLRVPVGSQCHLQMPGQEPVLAEVVGFAGDRAFLMPAGDIQGLSCGATVTPAEPYVPPLQLGDTEVPVLTKGVLRLPMGDGLLGRVVDSQGVPLDHAGPLANVQAETLDREPINAMERAPVRESLDTGVRAINALLTVGRGQRLGLFAGSGVGKSVLLGMMARYTKADVIVVGLIGERGREVKEFVEDILGAQDRSRAVVVAAPADAPPLLRMQGANYATAIAEHFRDKGENVLFIVDSVTRFAHAIREVATAAGEPPIARGYPASVFTELPRLLERAGPGAEGAGTITAIISILVDGDNHNDPIADSTRGILDGHIVLDRALADEGRYPPINPLTSISRLARKAWTSEQEKLVSRLKALIHRFEETRDLRLIGGYRNGSDPDLDMAIKQVPVIYDILKQTPGEKPALDAYADLANALKAAASGGQGMRQRG